VPRLREAKVFPQGGRGLGGPEIGIEHATCGLLALLGAQQAKDAAATLARLENLDAGVLRDLDDLIGPAELMEALTNGATKVVQTILKQINSLDIGLVEHVAFWIQNGHLLNKTGNPLPSPFAVEIRLAISRLSDFARLEVLADPGVHANPQWPSSVREDGNYLIGRIIFTPRSPRWVSKSIGKREQRRGDLEITARITSRTLIALSGLFRNDAAITDENG